MRTDSTRVKPEQWARWVLHRRHAGHEQTAHQADRYVAGVRAKVLELAAIRPGDTVLDVASRDGFFGLGAAELTGPTGKVIFTEESDELLDTCRRNAEARGFADRCEFVKASPDDLTAFADRCADVVVVRSVLTYLPDRPRAIDEYFRVLRPGGRFACVQMFTRDRDNRRISGFDVGPHEHLAAKVLDVMDAARPAFYGGFDEHDLLGWIELAGFGDVDFESHITIRGRMDWPPPDWELTRNIAAGPDQPTIDEAITAALSPEDAEKLRAHLKAEVEGSRRSLRFRKTYIGAVRPGPEA